jgi:hypothetical protein
MKKSEVVAHVVARLHFQTALLFASFPMLRLPVRLPVRLLAVVAVACWSAVVLAEQPSLLVLCLPSGGDRALLLNRCQDVHRALTAQTESLRAPPVMFSPTAAVKRSLEASALAKQADASLEGLRLEQAATKLKSLLALAQANPLAVDAQLFEETLVKLSSTFFRLSEEKEAKKLLADLARQSSRQLPPDGAAPFFALELSKAKERVAKLEQFPLSIDGPEQALAFVDGTLLGHLPLRQVPVTQGVHHIRVIETTAQGDTTAFAKSIHVKEPLQFRVNLSAVERSRALRSTVALSSDFGIDDLTLSQLSTLARAAEVSHIAVARIDTAATPTDSTAFLALYALANGSVAALPALSFRGSQDSSKAAVRNALSEQLKSFSAVSALPHYLRAARAATKTSVPTERAASMTPQIAAGPTSLPTKDVPVDLASPPPATASKSVPTWVIIAGSVAAAAAVGVGSYVIYSAASRPVTGTVTATW